MIIFMNKILFVLHRLHVRILSYIHSKRVKHCGAAVRFENISLLVGGEYISIGDKTTFQRGLYLTAWHLYDYKGKTNQPSIVIGNGCDFGAYNHITCTNKISIGNHVLTGKWVTISDNNHGRSTYEDMCIPPQERKNSSKGEVIIGNNVFIGEKATILSGVTIGDGAIIGANSVVTHDIPAFCVAVGNPAKIVKQILH